MTIADNITALTNQRLADIAKVEDVKAAIRLKKVNVSESAKLGDIAGLVGEIKTTGDWIRPSDWLEIDSLVTPGEQKLVGLVAIYPTNNDLGMKNSLAFTVAGAFTVNWGDGLIENIGSGDTAKHIYNYENISSSTNCARGYKQVIVTVIPQIGNNITNINLSANNNTGILGLHINQWLDITVSTTHLSTAYFASGSGKLTILEALKTYQQSTELTMFTISGTTNLKFLDIDNLNMSSVTTLNFSQSGLEIINLGGKILNLITSFAQVFFRNFNLKKVILPATSTYLTNCNAMFGDCSSLQIIDAYNLNMSNVIITDYMFNGCNLLQKVDLSHTNLSKATIASPMFGGCSSIAKLRIPGVKKSFSVAYCPLIESELNLLFGDLFDLTGQPSQTITITGCLGAATCNKTIATNKNWTVIG